MLNLRILDYLYSENGESSIILRDIQINMTLSPLRYQGRRIRFHESTERKSELGISKIYEHEMDVYHTMVRSIMVIA